MADHTLAEAWERYRELAIPPDAGIGQFVGTRDAFFAGFAACYRTFQGIILDELGEAEGTRRIDALEVEILAHFAEIRGRRQSRDGPPIR